MTTSNSAGRAALPASLHERPGAGLRVPPGMRAAPAPDNADLLALCLAAQRGGAWERDELLGRLTPLAGGAARRALCYAQRRGLDPLPEVDDLRQEARVAILQLIGTFRPERGPLLPYLLHRVDGRLRRVVEADLRRQPPDGRTRWSDELAQTLAGAIAPGGEPPEGAIGEALAAAFDSLALRPRRALFLFYWRELSDAQIATVLRVSLPAARQLRYRALLRLRELLERAGYRSGGRT